MLELQQTWEQTNTLGSFHNTSIAPRFLPGSTLTPNYTYRRMCARLTADKDTFRETSVETEIAPEASPVSHHPLAYSKVFTMHQYPYIIYILSFAR